MENPALQNETRPPEIYSFKYKKDEIKEIHKKQLRPSINALIMSIVYVVVLTVIWILTDMSDILWGILSGIFLLYIIATTAGILSFRKKSAESIAKVEAREYVYSFFETSLKIEVYEQETKISEEIRNYSEIQNVIDIDAYFLLTVVGRTFIIRKSELAENTQCLTALEKLIKKAKEAKKRRKTALIIVLICTTLSIVFMTLGKAYEKFSNDQAMTAYETKMKSVIDGKYDDYELLSYFNVKNDGKIIDVLCLVETGDSIDVLSYCLQENENIVISRSEDLTPDLGDVYCYLLDGSPVIIRIYTNEKDIPELVSVKEEFQYKNQTAYFCITFAE